jgi:hypothetical protein
MKAKPQTALAAVLLGASLVFISHAAADETSLPEGRVAPHPALAGRTVLFVTRHQYQSDHHATATLFQNGEINANKFQGGSALRAIDFTSGQPAIRTLLEAPEGVIRDPEVSFDGRQIVFSMRRRPADEYHLYVIDSDGTNLRQLTFLKGVTDIDPEWLPGGGFVFSSTRDYKFCQCNRHIMANLFRMDADGANVQRIGGSTLFEGHPHVMPDGRVLYDRWEYVDRHFGPSFGLWAANPDGTGQILIYGNNAWSPGMIADARVIPGTSLIVATFGSCHDRPWGAIGIIDRTKGLDGTTPVLHTWPENIDRFLDLADLQNPEYGRSGRIDAFKGIAKKYEDPYPVSATHFLCARQMEGEQMGLFLLDTDGSEQLIYRERPGCFDPMLIAPREPAPRVASRSNPAREDGLFYVADVYRGVGMENVPRGSIKWLRVAEAPAKITWTDRHWGIDATQAPAMNWNLTNNKRILGRVPVEEDGSAYFHAPADRFLFFQLLDEKGRMVQSMRSGTILRPGEIVGCVGCHEQRQTTVPAGCRPLALSREPDRLHGWYGEPRDFNYLTEVQPVFDRNCVSCHDSADGPPAGGLDLSGDLGLVFNTSYLDIRSKSPIRWAQLKPDDPKPLIRAVDDGPPQILPAYAWGSTQSRLVDVLLEGHADVELTQEELDRIVTWIDMNAPYYGSYASAYPNNPFGRSPLTGEELARLSELTGMTLGRGNTGAELGGSQISFTRPELSRCLAALKEEEGRDDAYAEALSLIQIGAARLARQPRADMPGFVPGPVDASRLEKAAALIAEHSRATKALIEGDRHLDTPGGEP